MINFMIFVPAIVALFVWSLCFGISASTKADIHGRIFNGQDAIRRQFHYVAALIMKRSSFWGLRSEYLECAGALIGPQWVLTAAHCVDGVKKVAVYLGAYTADDSQIGYEVRRKGIILHPDWKDVSYANDIALVRIPMTAECPEIGYARLPFRWTKAPANVLEDMTAIAVGWGMTGDDGKTADRLQWTKMAVMSNDECLNSISYITDSDLCGRTSRPYGSFCIGDSGGPLVLAATRELIGIASYLPDVSCEKGDPAVFMRVTSFLPWITRETGISI